GRSPAPSILPNFLEKDGCTGLARRMPSRTAWLFLAGGFVIAPDTWSLARPMAEPDSSIQLPPPQSVHDATRVRERAVSLVTPSALSWAVICYGAVLRLGQYAFDKSIWGDESFVVASILGRGYF